MNGRDEEEAEEVFERMKINLLLSLVAVFDGLPVRSKFCIKLILNFYFSKISSQSLIKRKSCEESTADSNSQSD